MKLANANKIRKEWLEKLNSFVANEGEDCGVIASNSFNFPVVVDGEEGFIEVVIKVPKDNGDDGFIKRDMYADKVKAKAEKAKADAEAKAKKMAYDQKMREAKAKAKAEKGV